ncbi:MAG: PTS sugar transporter subunit IIC, partial [Clostridiales bacterium]|nr:PTS sugar transporter subunit IIC [Clostridiales bacterium]
MKNKKEALAAKISADDDGTKTAEEQQPPTTDDGATSLLENETVVTDNAANDVSTRDENFANSDETTPPAATAKEKRTAKQWLKYFAHRYFIEAFSGMSLGLFCTLIIGTIVGEVGVLINKAGENWFGDLLFYIGNVAKSIMGAGIGVGIAHSLKANKLTSFSAAVAGMVGANITSIFALSGIHVYGASKTPSIGIGDPVGAFVAAVTAIEITRRVEGKTPVDIIVVPLCAIACGTVGAIALGIPFGILFALLGKGVSMAIGWEPVSFGILVSVIMGLLLTLPTSSAAFGVMIFQSSLINTPQLTYN